MARDELQFGIRQPRVTSPPGDGLKVCGEAFTAALTAYCVTICWTRRVVCFVFRRVGRAAIGVRMAVAKVLPNKT
jgi:hypothetical protein